MKHGTCYKKDHCNFVCPENSDPKPGRVCYDTFDDCMCKKNFYKKDGACVPCNYQCPEHSLPKENRKCFNNFDDCYCEHGYKKHNGICVEDGH